MLFRKKDNEYSEIHDIKNAVEDKIPEIEHITEQEIKPIQKISGSAPLFVKIDKYREVLESIQEIKIFISGIKQMFNIMQEIESTKKETDKIMKATTQRLERCVLGIDSILLKPKGADQEIMQKGEAEVSYVKESLTELKKQLSSIKDELHEL